jgi:hypothetical protein
MNGWFEPSMAKACSIFGPDSIEQFLRRKKLGTMAEAFTASISPPKAAVGRYAVINLDDKPAVRKLNLSLPPVCGRF